jgi:hypothetical protein
MLRKEQDDLLTRPAPARRWATDNGIVVARSRLMRAARALADKGEAPPGTDPATHHVRSASVVLPAGQPFQNAAHEALTARPGVAPASVWISNGANRRGRGGRGPGMECRRDAYRQKLRRIIATPFFR